MGAGVFDRNMGALFGIPKLGDRIGFDGVEFAVGDAELERLDLLGAFIEMKAGLGPILPGALDFDAALGAVDHAIVPTMDADSALEDRATIFGEFQQAASGPVDAVGVLFGNVVGVDGLFAKGEATEGNAVAADIHETASADSGIVPEVVPIFRGLETESGLHEADFADGAFGDPFPDLGGLGSAAVHEGFHEEHVRFLHGLESFFGLLRVQGEGLLAENALARTSGGDGVFGMGVMGGGDVNGIDFRVLQEFFAGGVCLATVFLGEGFGFIEATGAYGDHFAGF